MKTDHITIGRNPSLTYAVLRLSAERQQRKEERHRRRSKILGNIRQISSLWKDYCIRSAILYVACPSALALALLLWLA